MRRLRRTPALGVSLCALVLAASGGAYAATTASSSAQTGSTAAGATTPIPLVRVSNGGAHAQLVNIAGTGALVVTTCSTGNNSMKYTNESSATQNYVKTDPSAVSAGANQVAAGTLAAGATLEIVPYSGNDLTHLIVSNGTGVADFAIASRHSASTNDCLFWGDAYSG